MKFVPTSERFLKDRDGTTAVGYTIMVELLAAVIISSVTLLEDQMTEMFAKIAELFPHCLSRFVTGWNVSAIKVSPVRQ